MKISPLISTPLAVAAVFELLFSVSARAADSAPIMPLSGIKPEMPGEWHTTVSGSRVDSFPMRVLGGAEGI